MEDLIRAIESSFARSDLPKVRPGDTVRVYVKVKEVRVNPKTKKPEEKVRLQAYEGVVIAERGKGIGKSIIVRKISAGIGVERIFPLASPSVERIEIVKRAKVRRANLGYLRGRIGKHAKLKDRRLSAEELNALKPAAPGPEPSAEEMTTEPAEPKIPEATEHKEGED
ncbi:MAG: 50S ribosomal protein L19 [candidate division WOR-3 bacterium]